MANKYYLARDDGETFGPFESAEAALVAGVMDLAEGLDAGVIEEFSRPAAELMEWHAILVDHGYFGPQTASLQYGDWMANAKRLVQSVDWIIYGVEFVVDMPAGSPITGVLHFLASADMLHEPHQMASTV